MESLFSINFIDSIIGVAVGDSGTILRSIDCGRTWSLQESVTTVSLWSVCFPDSNSGIVVGDGGTVLETTDGGRNLDITTGWNCSPNI